MCGNVFQGCRFSYCKVERSAFRKHQDGELYLCAFDGKIYRFYPSSTEIKKNKKIKKIKYQLNQNYPNPFNPDTRISYTLFQSAMVKIEISDMQGRIIKTLVNEVKNPGDYEKVWDGTNQNNLRQASGYYIYRILLDGQTYESKQMLLLK